MKIKFLIFAVSSILFCSSFIFRLAAHKAEWLVGTWVNHRHNGDIYESWIKINDNELAGKSYKIKAGDTVVLEKVQLLQKENILFFIPVVTGQNDGKPVSFEEIQGQAGELLFENKEHDFPQRISYRLVRPDSLVAEISGTRDGKTSVQTFPMKRVR
ncbi:DUF6265 family protein [Ferruginibacter sp. HRS2-29]|uniref:DUF6265 family protein n=1 Tax=Ferruginibacter sp. HRS2-29 TaxID=2487334 RepID=UPI0020CF186D|nr:DUF6265 family protein [Ferruginibacter sp. HRS2-29]MCP9752456.1 hypothetical protein [Ferruginibacter sp. HRS2-29]